MPNATLAEIKKQMQTCVACTQTWDLQAVWTLSLRGFAALPELVDMDVAPPWPVLVYV